MRPIQPSGVQPGGAPVDDVTPNAPLSANLVSRRNLGILLFHNCFQAGRAQVDLDPSLVRTCERGGVIHTLAVINCRIWARVGGLRGLRMEQSVLRRQSY